MIRLTEKLLLAGGRGFLPCSVDFASVANVIRELQYDQGGRFGHAARLHYEALCVEAARLALTGHIGRPVRLAIDNTGGRP